MIRCLVLPFALVLGGCAFIINGTTDSVRIESEPPGATIYVNGAAVARTPARIRVSRGYPDTITVAMAGYAQQEIVFDRHLDSGFILFDLLLTLGIGLPIDILTGAMINIYPDRARVQLRPDR